MSESNNNIPMKISQLPEATSYTDGMYYAVASASGGTQKIDANIPNLKTFNELKDINSRLGYNQNAFYTVNATYTVNNNILTCACASGWGYVSYNAANMKITNNSNLEYVVLTTHEDNYSIGICLNNHYFGKLIAFKYLPSAAFVIGNDTVLNGATYNINNIYTIQYIGGKKYNIYVNDDLFTVDLSEVSFTLDGVTYGFDKQTLGFTLSNNLDISVNFLNIIDVEELEKNIDKLLKYNSPNPIIFNEKSFINKSTTTSISNNIISSTSSIAWGCTLIKSYNITFKNAGNFEYLVLSTYNNYTLGLALSSNNFGKLVAFKISDASNFTFGNENLLVGSTYNANNIYKIVYNGNGVYTVYVNDKKYIIDLSEKSLTVSGVDVIFKNPFIGYTVPRALEVKIELIDENYNNSQVWKNKKWFAFGDSITAMGYYIDTVNNELETISTKFGHGGYSYKQLSTVYTEMIDGTTPDIITLFAGTNDFGHSGTIADMVSGMETIINGLYTAYPKVQLVIITPLQRNFDASQTPTETSGLGPNSLGLYLIDYVEKIREVAEKYSIPCLDFYSMGGINANNASVKTLDGLHPNSSYGDIMGYMIAKFIESLKPFN